MQHRKIGEKRWLPSQLVLVTLIGMAVIMGGISSWEDGRFDWRGLAGNLATELIGAVITYIILDQLIGRQQQQKQLKEQLIREMGSSDHGIAARAINEMRAQGWLKDGSLNGWFLQGANWENLYLNDANVNGLGVFRSNLKGARIKDEQLMTLHDLRDTILPNGKKYDGRFCLQGDLAWAYKRYEIDVKTATHQQMADFYGVPLETYLEGQRWAKTHLQNPPYSIQLEATPTPSVGLPRWAGLSIIGLVVSGFLLSILIERRK